MTAVARSLPTHDNADVTLRRADLTDRERVYEYNFASDVRAVSGSPNTVSYSDHVRWFSTRIIDPSSPIWIVEQYGDKFHDGTIPRDGSRSRARADHWAEYRVILSRPMSVHQSAVARRIIISAAPARSRLKAMDFRTAALLYGSRAPRDGSYTRGIV